MRVSNPGMHVNMNGVKETDLITKMYSGEPPMMVRRRRKEECG